MWVLKIILIILFAIIFFQDIKDRLVWWILFPLVGTISSILHLQSVPLELFATSIIFNLVFIAIILIVIYGYSKYKMKTSFLNVIGIGDIFLFFALAFSFSMVSFVVLFVFSLLITLLLDIILPKKAHHTIPLAGYMSLFFAFSYLAQWLKITPNFYSL